MALMRIMVAAAVAGTLTGPAAGQEMPVLGQGNVTCDSWLQRRAAAGPEADTMIAWLLGYITAYNEFGSDPRPDVAGGEDTEVLAAQVDRYCAENEGNTLRQASAALVTALEDDSE